MPRATLDYLIAPHKLCCIHNVAKACDSSHITLPFSMVIGTEPSHNTRAAGRTVFTSTRLQQVTGPNMKDRPKDLGLALQCKDPKLTECSCFSRLTLHACILSFSLFVDDVCLHQFAVRKHSLPPLCSSLVP